MVDSCHAGALSEISTLKAADIAMHTRVIVDGLDISGDELTGIDPFATQGAIDLWEEPSSFRPGDLPRSGGAAADQTGSLRK